MFSNPVVGGTTLVRPAIQSPNYVAGSSGWSINADGTAEFNGVTIRGTLQSSNFVVGTSGWRLQNSGTAEFNGAVTVAGGGTITINPAGPASILLSASAGNTMQMKTGATGETNLPFLAVQSQGSGATTQDTMSLSSGQISGLGDMFLQLNSGTAAGLVPSLQIWSGVSLLATFLSNRLDFAAGRVGRSVPHGAPFMEFANNFSVGGADYALLQGNSGDTYLNASAGQPIRFRIANNDAMQLNADKSFSGPRWGTSGSFTELWPGATWFGGGAGRINFLFQAGTAVIGYVGGNANIGFPVSFPSGLLCVIAINGDSGGSAGGPATVMSVSNPGLGACGTSHVQSTTGAGITGNVRVNYIAVGY